MYPAAADGKMIIALPAKLMVDLVAVCNNGAGEIFQKVSWMIGFTRRLPVKENDRSGLFSWAVTVYQHVGFLSVFDLIVIDAHHLNRCLVCMDDVIFIHQFV